MRAAKERKRMERVSAMIDVGGIRTDGILGEHFIRILSYGDGGRHYAITVDGEHRQARTERGILMLGENAIRKDRIVGKTAGQARKGLTRFFFALIL